MDLTGHSTRVDVSPAAGTMASASLLVTQCLHPSLCGAGEGIDGGFLLEEQGKLCFDLFHIFTIYVCARGGVVGDIFSPQLLKFAC